MISKEFIFTVFAFASVSLPALEFGSVRQVLEQTRLPDLEVTFVALYLAVSVVRVLWVSMRTVVSYDDIATPQSSGPTQLGPPLPSTAQPPAKKRRTSYQKAPQKRPNQQIQHWDDPGNNAEVMNYDDNSAGAADGMDDVEEEEESRYLTHDEIWDDSALIDAWNSATAEYEVSITSLSFPGLTVVLSGLPR